MSESPNILVIHEAMQVFIYLGNIIKSRTILQGANMCHMGNTFSNIENYGNGGIGLPWSAVLDASSMEYKWCDYAGEGTLDSNIQALLGQ